VRFQHMQIPIMRSERITQASLGTPDYPYAPDSTIAHSGDCDGARSRDSIDVHGFHGRLGPRRASATGAGKDGDSTSRTVVSEGGGIRKVRLGNTSRSIPQGEFYGGNSRAYDRLRSDSPCSGTRRDRSSSVEGDPGGEGNWGGGPPIDYQREF